MENALSVQIIGAAIEVHRVLGGPGLLEAVYEAALYHELRLRGLEVIRQVSVPVTYKNCVIKDPFLIDLLVENKVVIEVKATEKNISIYSAQTLTYLKLANKRLGLLINFGYDRVFEGVSRIVNGL
jgi:GxxExxY protein